MNADQILELMVKASEQVILPSNLGLVAMWARKLAPLSEKLTEDELYPLIALGAMVYQRGYREFEGSMTADLLIKTLRQGGNA